MTEPTVAPSRTCTKCYHEGPASDFHRSFSICKPCNKTVRKANLAAAQKLRRNQNEESKEKAREACRRWKREHPDRYKAAQKKWYDRNQEKKTKYSADYSRERRATDAAWHKETNRRVRERYQSSRNNPEWLAQFRKKSTAWSYRYRYGISAEDVKAMRVNQGGKCKLCQQASRILYVDHDHVTGQVRALLCPRCNTGLGAFSDSTTQLEKAIAYLREHGQMSLL